MMDFDESYSNQFDKFPIGFRFKPLDKELIIHYLNRKIDNKKLPPCKIAEVTISHYMPDDLAANYASDGDGKWYFFTSRERKYKNGWRPNRAVGVGEGEGEGYWKAIGKEKDIKSNGKVVGKKQQLVFFEGNSSKGVKTNWIMLEFVSLASSSQTKVRKPQVDVMELDEWVLCRLHKKASPAKTRKAYKNDDEVQKPSKDDINPAATNNDKEQNDDIVDSSASATATATATATDNGNGSTTLVSFNHETTFHRHQQQIALSGFSLNTSSGNVNTQQPNDKDDLENIYGDLPNIIPDYGPLIYTQQYYPSGLSELKWSPNFDMQWDLGSPYF